MSGAGIEQFKINRLPESAVVIILGIITGLILRFLVPEQVREVYL